MAEEGNAEAAVATPPTPETAPLVDSEGNFREGWTNVLDEDIRDSSYLKEVKSVQGMARSTVSARGMVGKDKIAKPTEASSEDEWAEFHKAGGRPDTAADYAFARPEELPEEYYSQELATAAQELFHKLGISKKQADALFEFNNNTVITQLTQKAQNAELEATILKDGLYADWGNAYEQKKHFGNKAIEEGTSGDADFKERLTQKFGNDPDFIRFAANIGGKFQEAGSIKIDSIPTPVDIQKQIDDAMGNAAYKPGWKKHGFTKQQHDNQVEIVSALFREKTKSTKTG